MPPILSSNRNITLKSLKLIALFLLSPLFIFAQTLTGLWIGTLTNDSNSVRKDQSYEIALTEYRGKVYGYSRSEFIVRDTLYYIVKRVKGTIDGDTCEVKDVEVLSDNFPRRPEKGVKVSSFFYRNKVDSTWFLAGKWKTTATKKYFSVTGKVDLKEEKDLSASKLFPHLQELNLADDVAFYKERKEDTPPIVMKKVESENRISAEMDAIASKIMENKKTIVIKEKPNEEIASIKNKEPVVTKPIEAIATEKEKTIPEPANNSVAKKQDPPPTTTIPVSPKVQSIPEPEKEKLTVKTTQQEPKKDLANVVTKPPPPKVVAEIKKPVDTVVANKAETSVAKTAPLTEPKDTKFVPISDVKDLPVQMAGRKSEFSQFVNFKSDSLELALYDNGEIDGDTVSIFLNGNVLLAKQCLKATAIKKTIYLSPGKDDEFTLVLFAENLGKYPPNTGLLVVHDGEDVYNVRFSADLQKNAGVLFKRKK